MRRLRPKNTDRSPHRHRSARSALIRRQPQSRGGNKGGSYFYNTIKIKYLISICGGGSGSGIERSLGCNALIHNDAVFLNPFSSDLGGEQRTKSVPPEPHRFVADIDAPLMQQVLDVAQREWEPHIHHYSQADDFRRRLEVLEWVGFGHDWTLRNHPALHKPVSSDTAPIGAKKICRRTVLATRPTSSIL